MENKFDKVMSDNSDFILYEILHHKRNEYNPEAIVSAENEFKKRNIDAAKQIEFENKIQSQKNHTINKQQETTELISKFINFGKLIIPTRKGSLSKNLTSITLFFTAVYIYYLANNFSLTTTLLFQPCYWDLNALEYLLPFLLYPIAIYGFWKIKKYGWYLIVSLLTYSLVTTIFSGLVTYYIYNNSNQEIDFSLIFTQPNIRTILIHFLVFFGFILYLNKKNTITYYGIRQRVGFIFVLTLFTVLLAFFIWRSFY